MDIETRLVNGLAPDNKSELKVGDKVNALVFPSIEVNGIIEKIDGHMVLIEGKGWTPKILCRKI